MTEGMLSVSEAPLGTLMTGAFWSTVLLLLAIVYVPDRLYDQRRMVRVREEKVKVSVVS